MKKITILLLIMCFLSEFISAQTYPGTPVSNPVRTYTQNDTKGVWVIGNGAPIFSPTAKMSQLYFDYMNQTGYFWNGSAWVAWTNDFLRTASNGLTEDGTDVKLGGTLTEPTTIDLDGNDFIIEGAGAFALNTVGDISMFNTGGIELRPDTKFEVNTLGNIDIAATQDIIIETDDVINIQAVNGGSIIADNNDFVLEATAGDVQINSPGTTAGVVNGIAYKSDIANSVAVTDYGVNTTTAGVPDDGKVWTYNSTSNEMELQTLPSAIPGLNTIGANQLTSGLRDSITLNNWNLLGNTGTSQATNFMGTTDARGLSFRTNNIIRQTIRADGEVGIGTIDPQSKLDINTDGLGVTQTNTSGLLLSNTTAAAAGAQQISPAIRFQAQGWKTTATAASQTVDFRMHVLPVEGTTAPSGSLVFQSSINGAAYADRLTISSAGALAATSISTGSITISGNINNVLSGIVQLGGSGSVPPNMYVNTIQSSVGIGITGATASSAKLEIVGRLPSGSAANSIINMADTWNTSGTPTAFKMSITNTASNAASLLMDLRAGVAGTTSMFKVGSTGLVTVANTLSLPSTGAAPTAGTATLVAGTVTVNTTAMTATAILNYNRKTLGGVLGNLTYTQVDNTSFTITSDNALDTSVIVWNIIETY